MLHHDQNAARQKRLILIERFAGVLPGLALCAALALFCSALQQLEQRVLAHPYIEALVLAILLGMVLRSVWMPGVRWQAGIAFSAKQLLELAVMLLGASISFAAIAASGLLLFGAIVLTVLFTIGASFLLSRMLGLSTRLSILVACGNSICGNSAIAAVAPVIGADADEIASSISFTAILGVVMVLGLPLLIPLLHLSATQYGIVAGLTVYAVPQVLAATVPAGIVSTQIGTLVKLVRVLMLGPVVLALSFVAPRLRAGREIGKHPMRASLFNFVPWFITGFVVLSALRSLGVVPAELGGPIARLTAFLTVVSMAALGLGVDIRVLANVGGRVTAAVTLSLSVLLAISLGLIGLFE